jgi:MarR family transcriptional regulator, temperature-dependent positive regulator of motility
MGESRKRRLGGRNVDPPAARLPWSLVVCSNRSTVERCLHHPITDETRYRLLSYLAAHPEASQRELASELGISLGKINYCLRALMQKGWVKVQNFRRQRNKLRYAYVLTPNGLEERVKVTYRFLKARIAEYETIAAEIERLTSELQAPTDHSSKS